MATRDRGPDDVPVPFVDSSPSSLHSPVYHTAIRPVSRFSGSFRPCNKFFSVCCSSRSPCESHDSSSRQPSDEDCVPVFSVFVVPSLRPFLSRLPQFPKSLRKPFPSSLISVLKEFYAPRTHTPMIYGDGAASRFIDL
jgi:hypothetical protein